METERLRGGLRLSWWQVITLCIAMGVSIYTTLAKADEKQQDAIKAVAIEVKREVKLVAECKLDKKAFTNYKVEHQRANERLLDKFEAEFKGLAKQVSDSEKKIIRLLTIQETRRNNSGG
jgi:hypothetical protein